jgi:hypothetical protein
MKIFYDQKLSHSRIQKPLEEQGFFADQYFGIGDRDLCVIDYFPDCTIRLYVRQISQG